MNSKKVTTDKYSMTKGSELYAFWEYDTPPYVLGGVTKNLKIWYYSWPRIITATIQN